MNGGKKPPNVRMQEVEVNVVSDEVRMEIYADLCLNVMLVGEGYGMSA